MPTKRLKRPRDPIQLAKLIGDIATGQVEDAVVPRNPKAVETGKIGGEKRAAILAPKRRAEIARKAAKARWTKRAATRK